MKKRRKDGRGIVLDDRVSLGFVVRYGYERTEEQKKIVCFKASWKEGREKGNKENGPRPNRSSAAGLKYGGCLP